MPLPARTLIFVGVASFFLASCANLGTSTGVDSYDLSTAEQHGPAITGAEATELEPVIEPDPSLPPLPIEKTGKIETLPSSYPESWILVDEASFASMFGGKVIIMDAAEERHAKRIKGLVTKNLLGNLAQAKTRGEFYVMETFHARGSRGELTDVLVIYDKSTLEIKREIFWPEHKRLTALPERYAMALSEDERYLYVSNFSPASSFTVVDLDKQEIVSEVGTPGCVLTYPSANRGVSSLCSNGGMLSSVLTDEGQLASQVRMAPFFDTDDSPIFEHPAIIDGIAYFPSFLGLVHEIDMRADEAKYLGHWSLVSEQEKADNRRPSGLVLNDFDDQGLMYTIFQSDGHEGSQTHGGTEVWVFDVEKKQRVSVIDTPNWAISIAVTRGENPLLIVTNGELNLDVFNAKDGSLLQTLADFGQTTPLLVNKGY